jgi:hypothetical protein
MTLSRLMSDALLKTQASEAAPDSVDTRAVSDALSVLTKYFPAEVISLYLPSIAAVHALDSGHEASVVKAVFWGFGALGTPVLSFGIYLQKWRVAGLPGWPPLSKLPVWGVLTSIIAFWAWALTLPGNPYTEKPGYSAVSGVLAITLSVLLNLFEPLPSTPVPQR